MTINDQDMLNYDKYILSLHEYKQKLPNNGDYTNIRVQIEQGNIIRSTKARVDAYKVNIYVLNKGSAVLVYSKNSQSTEGGWISKGVWVRDVFDLCESPREILSNKERDAKEALKNYVSSRGNGW